MKNFIEDTIVLKKYRSAIREKAISKAKVKIALAGLKPEDMNSSDLEAIVKDEEDEITNRIKKLPLYAIIAMLGFGVW